MSDLWADSLSLMLLGMGTVFVFLTLLVIATCLMSAVVSRLPSSRSDVVTAPASVSGDDQALAAVAAVARHVARRADDQR
ncbi:MAG: OadG family protein [Cellvibrionaceae bacterium]|nr:OadG family protein [Cellvibrionaceae bacterium]